MGAIHSSSIERSYQGAGLPGVALKLIAIFITWVLPFLVAYATTYLWTKEMTYWEQADVLFVNKALVTINGINESDPSRAVQQLAWVSIPKAEQYLGNDFHPMRLTSYEEDVNDDSKTDRIYLDIETFLPQGFRAYSLDVVCFFQFDLTDMIDLQMESIGHVHHSAYLPFTGYRVDADLKFEQRGILVFNPFTEYNEIYNISKFSENTIQSPLDLVVSKVVRDYGERNETTKFKVFGESAEFDRGEASVSRPFSVSLMVRNVAQPITHSTDFPQVVKFALMQYFVFWYIFRSLSNFICKFLVEGGVVNTIASSPELDELHKRHRRIY